jgi:hypothetical protein
MRPVAEELERQDKALQEQGALRLLVAGQLLAHLKQASLRGRVERGPDDGDSWIWLSRAVFRECT